MTKKLLLADDSITIKKVVGIIFANEDVELICADNYEDALAKIRTSKPDLVLADVHMPPGPGGYELTAALKKDPNLKNIPILLLGKNENFDEGRLKSVGAAGFMTKPFTSQEMLDRVNGLIKNKAPEQAAPKPAPPPPPPPPTSIEPELELSPFDLPQAKPEPFDLNEPWNDLPPAPPAIGVQVPLSATAPAKPFSPPSSPSPLAPPPLPSFEMPPSPPDWPATSFGSGDTSVSADFDLQFSENEAAPGSSEIDTGAFKSSAFEPPGTMLGLDDPHEHPATTTTRPSANAEPVSLLDAALPLDPELAADAPGETAVDFGIDSFSTPTEQDFTAPPEPTRRREPPSKKPPAAEFSLAAVPANVPRAVPPPATVPTLPATIDEAALREMIQQTVERVVWEVVPEIAEKLIREELSRLLGEKP